MEASTALEPRFRPRTSPFSIVLSFLMTLVIVVGFFVIWPEKFDHWFIYPVFACGFLIGIDCFDWLTGSVDVFDPIGIFGTLGVYLFLVSPLLIVAFDYEMLHIHSPMDWRPWLGEMALYNFVGLIFYFVARRFVPVYSKKINTRRWEINYKKAFIFIGIFLIFTGIIQIWFYARFGGIWNYMRVSRSQRHLLKGTGWITMLSESFPILMAFLYAIYKKKRNERISLVDLTVFLIFFFFARLFFGGLKGSRSTIIWALFWTVGVTHYMLRRIPRYVIYFGLFFLVIFSYGYGFYKTMGVEVFDSIRQGTTLESLEQRTNRNSLVLLIADFSRSDVQAFFLYRLSLLEEDFPYAWGRTYLGAAFLIWPWQLWPSGLLGPKPAGVVKEGTNLEYGLDSYSRDFSSSRVYGLAGEAMVNFGPYSIPFFFFLFGLMISWVRQLCGSLHGSDIRLLMLPFLVNFCFNFFTGNTTNSVFFLVKNGAIPFLIILWCSTRRTAPAEIR